MTTSRRARWPLRPVLVTAQAVPVFALAPVLPLWLGYGMPSKFVTIALVTYFPIASALFDRLMALPPGLQDLARLSGAGRKLPRLSEVVVTPIQNGSRPAQNNPW